MGKQVLASQLHFYTDACFQACAGYMGSRWFTICFPDDWHKFGITFLEMFPIVAAMAIFGHKFANHRVLFHSDNQAAVFIINKQSSRSPRIMKLVSQLVLLALRHNVQFFAQYLPGLQNERADKQSRLQVTPADLHNWGMSPDPEPIPLQFQPSSWSGQ